MTEPVILPADDDDFLGDNVVSSGEVYIAPAPKVIPVDPTAHLLPAAAPVSVTIKPGVVPPEEYDRENAVLAPDGSELSEAQLAKPHLFRAGDPPKGGRIPIKANRVNVREIVQKLSKDTMLNPIEVLYYIMNANEEARSHLGLKKSDRISANLRAKCAQELLAYMAPKLKSVEVKSADDDGKSTGVQIFLPANTREHGAVAQQPVIVLPEKDGVTVPFSPELADVLLGTDDDEVEDWMEGEE